MTIGLLRENSSHPRSTEFPADVWPPEVKVSNGNRPRDARIHLEDELEEGIHILSQSLTNAKIAALGQGT